MPNIIICNMQPLLIFVLAIFLLPNNTNQLSLEEELSLTYQQKLSLDKLRDRVTGRLPHEWMMADIYLSKWLRVKNWNVQAAEEMLMANVKWRADNNMDTILSEDWSDLDNEYRIGVEGCDVEGRPVVSVQAGLWDIRKKVLSGKTQRMMRYFDKLLEESTSLVRELQKEGQNVTQFVELIDLNNFNFVIHGCAECIAIYASHFTSYESHYPLSVHRTVAINAPTYFHSVFQILRPLLSPYTREAIRILGRDRNEWRSTLFREIDEENLSTSFGGKKEDNVDFNDIRNYNAEYQCRKGDNIYRFSYNDVLGQEKQKN